MLSISLEYPFAHLLIKICKISNNELDKIRMLCYNYDYNRQ
nr:MAG TPA: hypothetical protein [Caudoviricetes sp.]